MKTLSLILILILISLSLVAQQSKYDSLKRVVTTTTSDSTKYITLMVLYSSYREDNRDSALYYVQKALVLAKQNKKSLDEAHALGAKGYILSHLGKYGESFKCFQEAFKIAENPANEIVSWSNWGKIPASLPLHEGRLYILTSIHNSIGLLYGRTDKTDKQIFHYKETKRLAEVLKDTLFLGSVNMNLGNSYIRLNKLDSALVMEQNAERFFVQSGNKQYLSRVFQLMGSIYMKKGNNTAAIKYYRKAIKSGIEQNSLVALSGVYSRLSEFYLTKEKNRDSCLYYARKNLSLRVSMGSKNMGEVYSLLYRSFQLNNKIDSAYKYQGLALVANDSSNKEQIKNLSDFQNRSFDEQFRLQELEKDKIKIQSKITTYSLLAGLAVLFIIGFILYRSNRQKQKANVVLENTLKKLKSTQVQLVQSEKLASLGELMAGIAHEIQNPLNFVNNFSEMSVELAKELKEEVEKPAMDKALIIELADDLTQNQEKITHHGKRASSIVKGMLEHSRTSTGVKELTDINKIADEFLRLTYHGLRAKDSTFNADFKTDFDKNLPKINVVSQDIGRVLLNLISNAFYAARKKENEEKVAGSNFNPCVIVSTEIIDNQIAIKIKDNGTGMSEETKAKIFQPFFTTKPPGEGTGLGLSLSYDIIKAHGGMLECESVENEGTTFVVRLPTF